MNINNFMKSLFLIFLMCAISTAKGHGSANHLKADTQVIQLIPQVGEVVYLGNAGLMVSHDDEQIMFDPFFHNHYDTYQLVPDDIRTAIFNDKPPYDSIEMILISHAHGDHFDSKDVVEYLKTHPKTRLLAPTQAVEKLKATNGFAALSNQVSGIDLAYGDQPIEVVFGDIKVEAVRIPHAGWPARADVSNLVYRVTLNDDVTVMHMGDADPDDVHFKPWASYWEKQVTDNAFPPYWFLTSETGMQILSDRINAKLHTGVHVPVKVPDELKQSGQDYFSEPGKVFRLKQMPLETNMLNNHQPTNNNDESDE